ncbi:MAG: hypothetical protein OJF51_000439 [Nitrospira sp.]|nr:MAG: hypothetical protein OJF51_000439 [Nitrospira sp.]
MTQPKCGSTPGKQKQSGWCATQDGLLLRWPGTSASPIICSTAGGLSSAGEISAPQGHTHESMRTEQERHVRLRRENVIPKQERDF